MSIPIPEYMKIRQYVLGVVEKSGDVSTKILPERKLCEVYKVSRGTVRKALEDLVNEKYLVPKRGMGTFTNPHRTSRKSIKAATVGIVFSSGMTININSQIQGCLIGAFEVFSKNNINAQFINFSHKAPELVYQELEPFCLDGILWLYPYFERFDTADYLYSKNIPLVIVNNVIRKNWSAFVKDDYSAAVKSFTGNLLRFGCDDIVFAGIDELHAESKDIYANFLQAFDEEKKQHSELFSLKRNAHLKRNLCDILSMGKCNAIYSQGGDTLSDVIEVISAVQEKLPPDFHLLCQENILLSNLSSKIRIHKISVPNLPYIGNIGAEMLKNILYDKRTELNRIVPRSLM